MLEKTTPAQLAQLVDLLEELNNPPHPLLTQLIDALVGREKTPAESLAQAQSLLSKLDYVAPSRGDEGYYQFKEARWSQHYHPSSAISNARYLAKHYSEVVTLYGGGTWGEAVIPESNIPKLWGEVLDNLNHEMERLENYPLLDEDGASAIEFEAQGEAWVDWARDEFIRQLGKKFKEEFDHDATGMS